MQAERQLPAAFEPLAARVVDALQQEATRYTASGATPCITLEAIEFKQVTDSYSQQAGYEGVWRNARKERCGTLTLNGDGTFYAEYDLFCAHPRDARWFVEMVTAWGDATSLRSEAKLAPAF